MLERKPSLCTLVADYKSRVFGGQQWTYRAGGSTNYMGMLLDQAWGMPLPPPAEQWVR
jgi:hypothetical protein